MAAGEPPTGSAADALLERDLCSDPPEAQAQSQSQSAFPTDADFAEPIESFDFGEAEAPFGGAESDPFAVSSPSGGLPPAAAGNDVSSTDLGAPLSDAGEPPPATF